MCGCASVEVDTARDLGGLAALLFAMLPALLSRSVDSHDQKKRRRAQIFTTSDAEASVTKQPHEHKQHWVRLPGAAQQRPIVCGRSARGSAMNYVRA